MIVFTLLAWRWRPGRVPAGVGTRRGLRPRTLLCLVPIALTGCQSFLTAVTLPASTQAAASEAGPAQEQNPPVKMKTWSDPTPKQAGFLKVTKEETYNVHLELGRYLENQENFELAVEEYQKALEACESRSPFPAGGKSIAKQAAAHRRMGAALDRLGHFEQSEAHYRTALKIHPNDPKVWNDAGYSYYLQGRWADAERALKTAASLDPDNTRIRTNLGLTLAASGKTNEALAAFIRAGGPASGHTNLGYVLAAMGQDTLALKHYRTALEYQPELGPAKEAIAAIEAKVARTNQIAARSQPGAAVATPIVAARLPVAGVATPVAAPSQPFARGSIAVAPPSRPVPRAATAVALPGKTVARVAPPIVPPGQPVARVATTAAASSRAARPIATNTPPATTAAVNPPVIPPPRLNRPKPNTPPSSTVQAGGLAVKNPIDSGLTRASAPTLPAVPPAVAPRPGP